MKCPFCNGNEFTAHQVCHMDILVDGDNRFLANPNGTADTNIYESQEPFGPYTCTTCGAEFENLDAAMKPVHGPNRPWPDIKRVYHKLIRDKIPDILQAKDIQCEVVRTLDDQNYEYLLGQKLSEEVQEYRDSKNPEELADILEVLMAIAAQKNLSWDEIERLRQEKRAERGGFEGRTYLISTIEKADMPADADMPQILPVSLTIHCNETDETWHEQLYVELMPAACNQPMTAETTKALLLDKIRRYLLTPEGWESNRQSCLDYNWGDVRFELSALEPFGIYTIKPENDRLQPEICLLVEHDERLAPDHVKAKLVFYHDDIPLQGTQECFINFLDGTIRTKTARNIPCGATHACVQTGSLSIACRVNGPEWKICMYEGG